MKRNFIIMLYQTYIPNDANTGVINLYHKGFYLSPLYAQADDYNTQLYRTNAVAWPIGSYS